MATYKIKSGSGIEEGKHFGKIIKIINTERGEKKFKYSDIIIKTGETELKYSCPTPKGWMNPKSKYGKLLANFIELKEDDEVDPEKVLLDQEISFMTIDKEGFAEIVEDSIKPKK